MENQYQEKIDALDAEIVRLFSERLELEGQKAQARKAEKLSVHDASADRLTLSKVGALSPENTKEYTKRLYNALFDLTNSYQNRLTGSHTGLREKIMSAIEETPQLFPASPKVACQGTEGAYSHLAANKLFETPDIHFYKAFGDVFKAIEAGECDYGVIPIENSTAGSVHKVYDLMKGHKFSIVRSIRLKVDHNLLAKPGVELSEITKIYSHEQAINQCAGFLKTLPGVQVIPCENTAVAARMAATSEDRGIAALASRACLKYYPLNCLLEAVQDQGNNHTRFICITKHLQIFPGADRTTLMATLPHEMGALYKMLSKLYSLGINLNKIESRPLPDRDFEFMFYFDLDVSVYSPNYLQLMDELHEVCESCTFLGSYSEII